MKMNRKRMLSGIMVVVLLCSLLICNGMSVSATTKSGRKIQKIQLNRKSVSIAVGKQYKLKIMPKSASRKVIWKSSNKKVATVTNKGIIKAKRKGKATIYVRARKGKAYAKCKVIVKARKKSKSNKAPTPTNTPQKIETI